LEHLTNLGIALALGLLIGIERGWTERSAEEGRRIAGSLLLLQTPSAPSPCCVDPYQFAVITQNF